MSPVFYILVSLAIASAVLSSIFFVAWKTLGRMPHALTWSIAFVLATFQWITNLLRQLFPSDDAYWIFVNGVTLVTLTLFLLGHCQRVNARITRVRLWIAPSLLMAVVIWFTAVSPHFGIRVGVVPVYAALTMLVASVLILRHRERPRPAEWGAAISMTIFAISQFVAAGAAFLQGATYDATYQEIYNQVNFLVLPAAYSGTGMFVIFMLASDLAENMREAAVIDQLTGLYNRRGFNDVAGKIYDCAAKTGRQVSVIMTDIDRFKVINDTFGHATGDLALRHFADILMQHRLGSDVVARVGGEEFALVLPDRSVQESISIAEKLCSRLAATPIVSDQETLTMTASFGVASISKNDSCIDDIVRRADAALYRSKHKGRNQVDLESSQIILTKGGKLVPLFD